MGQYVFEINYGTKHVDRTLHLHLCVGYAMKYRYSYPGWKSESDKYAENGTKMLEFCEDKYVQIYALQQS